MALLDNTKMLLGITDDSKDNQLTYIGNLVTGMAMRYCKLKVMPDDFSTVLAPMVVERYRANGYGQESAPQTVSGITVGNETVSFAKLRNTPQDFIISNELTAGEKTMLTPFRKLWP